MNNRLFQVIVCVFVVLAASCTSQPATSERDPEYVAAQKAKFAKAVATAKRFEFTVRDDRDDDSEWRLGPVIVDNAVEVARLKDKLTTAVTDIRLNDTPFYEVLLGTFGEITIVYEPAPDLRHYKKLRLGTDTHLEFFADEILTAVLSDASFYHELLRLATHASERDPRLAIQTRPSPNTNN